MIENKLFKDYFDLSAARRLSEQIAGAFSAFDQEAFVREATRGRDSQEMMERVRQWSCALRHHLPNDVGKALGILKASLPAPLPDAEQITDGYLQWALGHFVADYGLDAPKEAFEIMPELTKRFSSEFAIRPFVETHPKKTFSLCKKWSKDSNVHLRRLASEGIRSRLPWGKVLRDLVRDPSPIFPVLENLKDDSEDYVRRSVANNLNDISKDHPERVIALCRAWKKDAPPERLWIIKHALRTLVKKGDPKALSVLGFSPPTGIRAEMVAQPKRVAIGDDVKLWLNIANEGATKKKLMVDFRVHYVKKKGVALPKVFKWKELELKKHEELTLNKRISTQDRSIRKHFSGKHKVDVQINGVVMGETYFVLR